MASVSRSHRPQVSTKPLTIRPVIVNPDSTFVVVTYWWGRGNVNKNTQSPCPWGGETIPEDEITRHGKTFDRMIEDWERTCRKARCNYLAAEYPEYAVKGMYQKAINFKPRFIAQALAACAPRSVLYIDGDMTVNRYPRLFDIPQIDHMSIGRHYDTRETYASEMPEEGLCRIDPYIYEAGGGIQFFGQSPQAREVLSRWTEWCDKNPTKSDDRLFDMAFNTNALMVHANIIQLPHEYLWFSQIEEDSDLDYRFVLDNFMRPPFISHPACLTDEERAMIMAGNEHAVNASRYPRAYWSRVDDHQTCDRFGGAEMPFYEFVFFPNKTFVSSLHRSLAAMDRFKTLKLVPYDERYGAKYNRVADVNLAVAKAVRDSVIHRPSLVVLDRAKVQARSLIPTILAFVQMGSRVIVRDSAVPRSDEAVKNTAAKAAQHHADFVCRNTNESTSLYRREYKLKIDHSQPVYFGPDSTVLKHLLTMSKDLRSLENIFNSTYLFLSRIHCHWR